MKTAIIDYDMGNLFSVQHACSVVGLEPTLVSDASGLMEADAAILPGVGAFGEAMGNLRRLDLVVPIRDFMAQGKPLLGVCLGMQLLFDRSSEFGDHDGLGLIHGRVERFPDRTAEGEKIRVPHIGWSRIWPGPEANGQWHGSPLEGISPGEYMYFIHSFYVIPDNPAEIMSVTRYGGMEYCSSIRRGNVFAAQFHPEKSAHEGLRIYKNFAGILKNFIRTNHGK